MIIGVALFEGAEELDWAGPWEVLAAWSKQWPDDGVRVLTLAREPGTITCAKGLQVVPEETWESAPPLDVLVYPGGRGTRCELADEAVLDWIRGLAGGGTVVASVCTGALLLARAGILEGRPAVTHHAALDDLRDHGVDTRPGERWIDAGDVLTAGGVTSGLDLALHLLERFRDAEVAGAAARLLEHQRIDRAPVW